MGRSGGNEPHWIVQVCRLPQEAKRPARIRRIAGNWGRSGSCRRPPWPTTRRHDLGVQRARRTDTGGDNGCRSAAPATGRSARNHPANCATWHGLERAAWAISVDGGTDPFVAQPLPPAQGARTVRSAARSSADTRFTNISGCEPSWTCDMP